MERSEIDTQLVLVSARESRVGDHWDKDDYDVRLRDGSGPSRSKTVVLDNNCAGPTALGL